MNYHEVAGSNPRHTNFQIPSLNITGIPDVSQILYINLRVPMSCLFRVFQQEAMHSAL